MPDNSAVKSTARAALRNNRTAAVAVAFIPVAATVAIIYFRYLLFYIFGQKLAVTTYIAAVMLGFFILGPLVLGAIGWFWHFTGGAKVKPAYVFRYFESAGEYRRAMSFVLNFAARLLISAVLSFLPYLILLLIGTGNIKTFLTVPEKWNIYIYVASRFFMVLGFIVFFISAARFYAAPVLFAAGDMHPLEAITLSRFLSQMTIGSFYVLVVGFSGWILLSLLGVTMFYTLPYMTAAYVIHCRFAIYHYNRTIELSGNTDFPAYRSTF